MTFFNEVVRCLSASEKGNRSYSISLEPLPTGLTDFKRPEHQGNVERVVIVRATIIGVEVENTCRTTVVLAPTFEPRGGRVREVGVYFTVFNLFHHMMKP